MTSAQSHANPLLGSVEMPVNPLRLADVALLARADVHIVRNELSKLRTRIVPPWLGPANPYPDGILPSGGAAFRGVAAQDLLEILAVRGPLHAMDGWSYLGRALNSLISGNSHAARHLAYYGELRAALSILASSGIGIFNRRNVVIDATGGVHYLEDRPTHDMCWATISEWALLPDSLNQMVSSLFLAGTPLRDPFSEFFPSGASVAASQIMTEWGFDLAQGWGDRGERNWSSYQPTALAGIRTTPEQDTAFLKCFWEALRPGGMILERNLLRILLEAEAQAHGQVLAAYRAPYERLDNSLKAIVPFDFLTRAIDPNNHSFVSHASDRHLPSNPYSMICRAALLLRLATGMAERNLAAAGIQPSIQFDGWFREFGVDHGLWSPGTEPSSSYELWEDVDLALDDAESAPSAHRHTWLLALSSNAVPVCQTERAALWGLFQ